MRLFLYVDLIRIIYTTQFFFNYISYAYSLFLQLHFDREEVIVGNAYQKVCWSHAKVYEQRLKIKEQQ